MSTSRRAAPLPPDQRRAAILAATVPLVRRHGPDVTTRQIATAAGVAEGTLFRVFPDKDSLVDAAVCSAFAPEPLLAELATVDTALPLEARLVEVVAIRQRRLLEIMELMAAVGLRRPPGDLAHHRDPGAPTPSRARGGTSFPHRPPMHGAFVAAVADLLEPDRDQLNASPRDVARLLHVITFAGTHVGITDGEPLTPADVVALLLDGVRRRSTTG